MKKYLPYGSGILMACIFGFSFLFSKNAIESIGVFELLFIRFLTAFVLMSVLIAVRIIKVDYRGKNLKPILIVAVWQPIVYFLSENSGLKYTTSSIAGVMIACIPVLVAILGTFILKEKPNKRQVISIIVSIAGVLLLLLLGGGLNTSGQLKGIIFLSGAVISGAMYNIFSRKASKLFTPTEITYVMMCVGTIAFGIIFVLDGVINSHFSTIKVLNFNTIIAILYLGVLSSVGAFLLANYTLSKLPAAQTSVFANLVTVVAVIAGVFFRNEAFGVYQLVGSIMIIAGVFGTNYFTKKPASLLKESVIEG
jgi:drug/metabolite transporter (DMT)-like permease